MSLKDWRNTSTQDISRTKCLRRWDLHRRKWILLPTSSCTRSMAPRPPAIPVRTTPAIHHRGGDSVCRRIGSWVSDLAVQGMILMLCWRSDQIVFCSAPRRSRTFPAANFCRAGDVFWPLAFFWVSASDYLAADQNSAFETILPLLLSVPVFFLSYVVNPIAE